MRLSEAQWEKAAATRSVVMPDASKVNNRNASRANHRPQAAHPQLSALNFQLQHLRPF